MQRFYCRNQAGRRRTFAEAPTTLLAPPRPAHAAAWRGAGQGRLACGGAGGARLVPDAPAPIRVGIDDWAMRSGSSYGKIVVDLYRQRVIDLLPDRSAPTLAGWLERHSGVELVARDRSTEYTRGASLGAPRRSGSLTYGICSPTCGRPSNAGSMVPMPSCGTFHPSLALPFVPPVATVPSPVAHRSWRRVDRAGCDGRPSVTRCGIVTQPRAGAPNRPCHGAGACHGTQIRDR
ncbi:transposase [Methylobacterium sp. Gmos1]